MKWMLNKAGLGDSIRYETFSQSISVVYWTKQIRAAKKAEAENLWNSQTIK